MTIKRVIIAIKVKPWGVFLPFVGEHDQSTHCSMQRLLWVFGLMKLAAHELHPISNSQCLSLLSWRSSSYHSFRHNHHHHWVYVITVIMSTGFIIVITRGTIITSLISPSWSVPSFWSLSFALSFTVAIICYRCQRCHMIITDIIIILCFIIVIVCIFIITSTMYCQKQLCCQLMFTSKRLWTLATLSSLSSIPGLSPMSYCHHTLPIWLESLERRASFRSTSSFLESYASLLMRLSLPILLAIMVMITITIESVASEFHSAVLGFLGYVSDHHGRWCLVVNISIITSFIPSILHVCKHIYILNT